MKKNLIKVSTVNMTRKDWIEYRHSGIGGSEVGTVMGLNPYKASIELYYDKLKAPIDTEANEAMFMGNILEGVVADLWQYWDGTPESMIKNHSEEKIIRRCRKINAYLHDPEFDFMFASLDRLINIDYTVDKTEEEILEIKNISGYSSKQWESGIPPSYVTQLQSYLMITGLKRGEIAMLKDGRYLEVIPFEVNQTIQNSIKAKAADFWSRVLHGRDILKKAGLQYLDNFDNAELMQKLSKFEPPADDSESYKEYLQTRYKVKPIARVGRSEDYKKALQIIDNNEMIKKIEAENTLLSNQLKTFIGEAEVLDFGTGGKITWRENKKGTRSFLVSGVKPLKPDLIDQTIPSSEFLEAMDNADKK
jgi:putative phage-type endonuclease